MNARLSTPLRLAAVTGVVSLIAAAVVTPADAADGNGDVSVVNTETVQVYTSSTGEPQTRRVYEQLSLLGQGSVDLTNPISTDHARNLDGFSGVDIKDGNQVVNTSVDGRKNLRSVSNFDGKLPLNVSVAYKLDGKNVKPGDVVGQDGKLEVQYTVENVTGEPQEVSFPDGLGGTTTKTVDVPIPMVGSLTLVAPPTFENVASTAANLAGDGKGGTKLSFTMTLFPPIGSTTAVFGYTADITDGVVPRAEIAALPINPLKSPTFAGAATSYKGGADTGGKLADGATLIDSNLLKLRDGAGDLLAGLIKLRDGAGQLNDGLAGQAAPGSQKLANGASALNDGLGLLNSGSKRLAAGTGELLAGTGPLADGVGKLNDGAHRLSDGASRLSAGANTLSAGTGKAADGSNQLYAGTKTLAAGATKVSAGATTVDGFIKQIAAGQGDLLSGIQLLEAGVKSLPTSVQAKLATDPQYQALLAGMQKVVDGIGAPTDVTNPGTGLPATIFGGLNAIQAGLSTQVSPGLQSIISGLPAKQQGLTCASLILKDLTGGADAPGPCFPPGNVRPPLVDETNPYNTGVLSAMATQLQDGATGLSDLSAGLTAIKQAVDLKFVPGLDRVKAGLSNPGAASDCAAAAATASPADDCGVRQAVAFFKASLPVLVNGITTSIRDSLLAGISAPAGGCLPTSKTLICGAAALAAGGSKLSAGTGDLAAGAGTLSAGASLLSSKTGELAVGLGQIDSGAGQIADGSGQLSTGAGQLATGTDALKAGGARLIAGVRKLDDGAGQLSDGTGKAAAGSQQLADGAGKLASGLQAAADGSGQLVGGLGQAADGAPKLVNGAQKLSDRGTKKLIKAGTSTAQSYGELYATIAAGAKRGSTEDMAFGAPADAIGLTAYSYIIQGDDGEGGRNLARAIGGLAILGAGGAVFALRRRLV